MSNSQELSKPLYYPGGYVNQFSYGEFSTNLSGNLDIIYYRITPVVGVGLLLFLFLGVWSCFRMFNWYGSRQPRRENSNKYYPRLFRAFTIILFFCSCIIFSFALKYIKNQNNDILVFKDSLDNIAAKSHQITDLVMLIKQDVHNCIELLNTTLFQSVFNANNSIYLGSLNGTIPTIQNITNDIENKIETSDDSVQSLSSKVDSYVGGIERDIFTPLILTVSISFILIFVQGVIAIMNSYCPRKYQPRKLKKFLWVWGLNTFIALVGFFVLFLFSGILLGLVTLTSNFCMNPQKNLLKEMRTNSSEAYYVQCLYNPAAIHPAEPNIPLLETSIVIANDTLSSISKFCNNTDCREIYKQIDGNLSSVLFLVSIIAPLFECYATGNEINTFMNLLCVDFVKDSALETEFLIAIACAVVLMELSRRLFPILYVDTPVIVESETEYNYIQLTHSPLSKGATIYDNVDLKETSI